MEHKIEFLMKKKAVEKQNVLRIMKEIKGLTLKLRKFQMNVILLSQGKEINKVLTRGEDILEEEDESDYDKDLDVK